MSNVELCHCFTNPIQFFIMRFLVTAGSTREMIDQVRAWGNIFTGNTGYAIARELSKSGTVDLLTSNTNHLQEIGNNAGSIHAKGFTTHPELKTLLANCIKTQQYHAMFMTAAVADYHPAGAFSVLSQKANADGTETWTVRNAQASKIKSTHERLAVLGEPTEKLIDLFRKAWDYQGLLVKFKLEVGISEEELKKIAEASRAASAADYIVANTLDMVEGKNAGAWLLGPNITEWIERGQLPERLAKLVREQS
jgi:phosphopantothenate---cysteine ligase (CTP)